jgi:hypothetical protein
MKEVEKYCWTVDTKKLEILTRQFVLKCKDLIKQLEVYKGLTINTYKGPKSNPELADDLVAIYERFKDIAGKFEAFDYLMRFRQRRDAANWSVIVRENRDCLRGVKQTWAELKRKYRKFFNDWQMCYLSTYCKNCREYHLCPDNLGIPRWKFLN